MNFYFIGRNESIPSTARDVVFLREDYWDDWRKFRTQFYLFYIDPQGTRHDIGEVKIGQRGLEAGATAGPNVRVPAVPSGVVQSLPPGFFSLGQSENYYESINLLQEGIRIQILTGLLDCAFNLDLFAEVKDELVMTESLLRHVSAASVTTRFHRLTQGDSVLTDFRFQYEFPAAPAGVPPTPPLDFTTLPESSPPTNVHVLIGRNGVGKSHFMRNLICSLISPNTGAFGTLSMMNVDGSNSTSSFAGLVSVSFSAFDEPIDPQFDLNGLRYTTVGIRQSRPRSPIIAAASLTSPSTSSSVMTPVELATEFLDAMTACVSGLRLNRWKAAIRTLENDPLFAEADVSQLVDLINSGESERVRTFFKKLSSGHAIVLLTVTKLVELVDERTLVLLDEPEGHLHPPLLSAFIRSLTELLRQRNGVAIIATHSPVVLQEVPKQCVWKLRRSGYISVPERPSIETFGENVGVLTREVFGLEVTNSGFHKLIKDRVDDGDSYPELLIHFNNALGAEGRSIAMALIAEREQGAPL